MKTDSKVRRDVLAEIEHEPAVGAAEIGVSVLNGIVVMNGTATSFSEKWAAEQAALRVAGVTAVVNEIDVGNIPSEKRSDEQIAGSVLYALESTICVPEGRIKAKVEHGWVTLEGTVDWRFQRTAAEDAVRPMAGVRGVTNLIGVKPLAVSTEVREKIKQALHQAAGT